MHARIREARRRTRLSQEAFAAKLGVSRGAVAQWEIDGGTLPAVKNIEGIAKLSGLMFEWLGTGRGPKVMGEPVLAEEPATYVVPLTGEEKQVLAAMRRLSPIQRKGLVQLLSPTLAP